MAAAVIAHGVYFDLANSKPFFIGIFLLFSAVAVSCDVAWWSTLAQLSTSSLLSGSSNFNKAGCLDLKGLSPGQATICELFKDHMPAVGQGAKLAINECEFQFKDHRWNCSTPKSSGLIGPMHKYGTKEAAFTYAIISAGVTHEIGRRCRLGHLKSCGCSEAPKPTNVNHDWTWGGCGDNLLNIAMKGFARDFIDVREKEESFKRSEVHGRSLMNRWNNEVGRRILKRHTKPKCKCHGTKYRTARRIQINSRGNMQFDEAPSDSSGPKKERQGVRRKNRSLTDLVYLEPSPDYCRTDKGNGTIGTQGRKDHGVPNSCDTLCCGRGYNSYTEEVVTKCQCKFQWCCQVVCRTCRNTTEIHICK